MSVTMHLYKVNPNVEYKGYYLDFATPKDFVMGEDGFYPIEKKEQALGAPMTSEGHFPTIEDKEYEAYEKWESEQKQSAWSDGKEHEFFDWTHCSMCYKKRRGWGELCNRMNGFEFKIFDHPFKRKYLCLDEVQYAQGWFFTKRFFKKEITLVICTTKEQMNNFFKQYVDINHPTDNRGKEAVERFLNAWEDGMIFQCAW